MQILERLIQLFFYTLKKTACKKEKPPIEAKKSMMKRGSAKSSFLELYNSAKNWFRTRSK